MSIIGKMLRYDQCCYWARLPTSDEFGKPQFDRPVELGCRWEGCTEEIIDHEGRKVMAKGKVYVPKDLIPGGVLWHGKLKDIAKTNNPFDNVDAWEIKRADSIPKLRNNEILRWVLLA